MIIEQTMSGQWDNTQRYKAKKVGENKLTTSHKGVTKVGENEIQWKLYEKKDNEKLHTMNTIIIPVDL